MLDHSTLIFASQNHKMKKLIFLSAICVMMFTLESQAQKGYSSSGGTSIGVRLGNEQGLTLKHHLGGGAAIEGILAARSWSSNLTVLYHFFHNPTGIAPGLDWFIGAGGHIWLYNTRNRNFDSRYYNGTAGIGIDGAIGMQYNFPTAPLNMSLDWKPSMNLYGGSYFDGGGFGLSIRYRFK